MKIEWNWRTILIGILIVGALFVTVILTTKPFAFAATFTPVYCRSYEFTCCNEHVYRQGTASFGDDKEYSQCPATSSKCVITSIQSGKTIAIGKTNCRIKCIIGCRWYCDDEIQYKYPSVTIQPGYYFYSPDAPTTFSYQYYKWRLDFTGKAASTTGVPVPGSVDCTIASDQNIYNKYGQLLKVGPVSYTTPHDECIISWTGERFICGNKEEYCAIDSDCGGHTYGNVECYARTKQIYGCRDFGTPPTTEDLNVLPTETPKWISYGKKCDIISAVPVQCCGDVDCGSGMFCDTNTFTCKTKVECIYDYDCGVSISCDRIKKELTKPVCEAGKCTRKKIQDIGCCTTQDCPTDWFCDTDYKCKESPIPKKPCPYGCCIGMTEYFDKPCAYGYECKDNKCIEKPKEGCSSCFSWLWNKIKPGYCEPQAVFKLNLLVTKIEISQDEVCPYVNIFFGVIILIVGLLIALFWTQIMLLLKRK